MKANEMKLRAVNKFRGEYQFIEFTLCAENKVLSEFVSDETEILRSTYSENEKRGV